MLKQWNKLPVEDIESYPRGYLKAVSMQSSANCCMCPTRAGVLDKMTSWGLFHAQSFCEKGENLQVFSQKVLNAGVLGTSDLGASVGS